MKYKIINQHNIKLNIKNESYANFLLKFGEKMGFVQDFELWVGCIASLFELVRLTAEN
jgi:hypothetical protein